MEISSFNYVPNVSPHQGQGEKMSFSKIINLSEVTQAEWELVEAVYLAYEEYDGTCPEDFKPFTFPEFLEYYKSRGQTRPNSYEEEGIPLESLFTLTDEDFAPEPKKKPKTSAKKRGAK